MESFRTSWSHFTPEFKGMKIREKKLVPFFIDLKPPLGFGKHQDQRLVAKQVGKMNLHGQYFFIKI